MLHGNNYIKMKINIDFPFRLTLLSFEIPIFGETSQ